MAVKKMDFKKMAADEPERQRKRAEERAALNEIARQDQLDDEGREHPPPKSGPDWRRQLGELYGSPQRCGDGWGVRIVPTKQQARQIAKRREEAFTRNGRDSDHLNGEIAVSIDQTGRERRHPITGTREAQYDMTGNEVIICETVPRDRG